MTDASTFEGVVLSFGRSPFGGGVVSARLDSGGTRRAVLSANCLPRVPELGERWRFTGRSTTHLYHGEAVQCQVALPLMPTGRGIVRLIAESKRFPGIGMRTATRLWDAFGDGLYAALATRDHSAIADAIGIEHADTVIQGFGLLSDEIEVLRCLDKYGVDPRTAATAAAIWGSGAIGRIEADPYVLGLLEAWATVDGRALAMGIHPEDERRLLAAVDEAVGAVWRRRDTASDRHDLLALVRIALGANASEYADRAVDLAVGRQRIVTSPGGAMWQGRAAFLMEREVEDQIRARLAINPSVVPASILDAAVAGTEAETGCILSGRQRQAVGMATNSGVSLIHGPAGTGKTMVVRAIVAAEIAARQNAGIHLVALSGRATRRIAAALATPGRSMPAGSTVVRCMTIARFLRESEVGRRISGGLLVVDEASMVDLPTMYQVLRAIPPTMRLVMMGDPAQLPPIGPGLVFHRLLGCASVPQVELTRVHRQDGSTGIPYVAGMIREGRLPNLAAFDFQAPLTPGVFIERCGSVEVARRALAVNEAMTGPPDGEPGLARLHALDIQILAATRSGDAGADALNTAVEQRLTLLQQAMPGWGLRIGSRVVWLKNHYGKSPLVTPDGTAVADADGKPLFQGFMNGAIGSVRRLRPDAVWVEFDDGSSDWVLANELKGLGLGWAISVHKAQGSAFRRVIVPIVRTRLLERSWLYTAVTRAELTCVLVGDDDLLDEIVRAEPAAGRRSVTLSMSSAPNGHVGQHDMVTLLQAE